MFPAYTFLSEIKLLKKIGKEIIKRANELGVNFDNKELERFLREFM